MDISNYSVFCVLLCICVSSVNNYFAYHAPSALAQEYESAYQLSSDKFGSLFTIYSAPNVVLVFISGLVIDKLGVKKSSLLFNISICTGMIVCAFAPYPSKRVPSLVSYSILLFGRFLLGLGGESICACTSTMLSKWFTKSGNLNGAMAFNQAIVQFLGSSAAFFILPHLKSLWFAQWFVVGVCFVSLIANIIYNHYEDRYKYYLQEQQQQQQEEDDDDTTKTQLKTEVDEDTVYNEESQLDYKKSYESIIQPIQPAFQTDNKPVEVSSTSNSSNNSSPDFIVTLIRNNIRNLTHHITVKLQSFSYTFWILLLHIFFTSPILYTFTAFGPLYLQETFELTKSPEAAGNATSLLYLAIGLAPIIGVIIDRIGHRSLIQAIASFLLPFLFLLLATKQSINPYYCFFLIGFVYSITESNGLALISIVVPSKSHGTAYGLLGCSISYALIIEPYVIGRLREITGSFSISIWIFVWISGVGAIFATFLHIYDLSHDRVTSR